MKRPSSSNTCAISATSRPQVKSPFFIVASARSGTTFLRLTLNAHPLVAVPPESRFITELWDGSDEVDGEDFPRKLAEHKRFRAWDLAIEDVRRQLGGEPRLPYARAISAAYEAYAEKNGKRYWGDKTPRYVEHIPFLAALFPDARFIHLVRDGRNVALSYSHVDFGPKNVARAARLWQKRVGAGMRDGRALPAGRYIEIRNEDLAEDVASEVHKVCDFLELDFDPMMLDEEARAKGEVDKVTHHHTPQASGRKHFSMWQEEMSPGDIEVFEAVAGDTLGALGYERRYPSPGPWAHLKARAALRGLPIGRLGGSTTGA